MATKTKKEKKINKKEVDNIIQQHVIFSMIAGAIPVPLIDIAGVTAIQLDMIKLLSEEYGVDFNRDLGKSVASSLFSATMGSLIGRAGASMLKFVPGIGTLLGIGSQVILAGASTYALGKVFEYHFDNNGNFFNFDMESMRKNFDDFFEKGKDIAEGLKTKNDSDKIFDKLESLKKLLDNGAITKEDYEKTKKELLAKLTE